MYSEPQKKTLQNTQKKLDKALKRNLEKNVSTIEKSEKTEVQKQSSEEIGDNDNTGLVDENEEE